MGIKTNMETTEKPNIDSWFEPKAGLTVKQEKVTEDEEEVCIECDGTGEVGILSQVYANEPHMADLGDTRPCPYCTSEKDEYDNQN